MGNITCVYSAVPNQVRAASLADRTGDVRLDCTNDGVYNPAGKGVVVNDIRNYIAANITVSLNTAVTGLLNQEKGADSSNHTSAVLVVNDNNSYFPTLDSVLPASDTCGTVGSPPFSTPDKRYPCPQLGRASGPNTLTWAIQFPVPGAPNDPDNLPSDGGDGIPDCQDTFDQEGTNSCFSTTTTIRITNIVANIAAIGVSGVISATVVLNSTDSMSIIPSNTQTVSNAFQGLLSDVSGIDGGFQCADGVRVVDIELTEGFNSAFKTSGAPTFTQGDFRAENGYPVLELTTGFPPQPAGGLGGGATQATCFKIGFRNVPDGVTLEVLNTVDDADSGLEGCVVSPYFQVQDICLQRVEGSDPDGAGGAVGDGTGDYAVPLSNGSGHVIYEVLDGDPFAIQDIVIPATFTCAQGSPTTNLQVSAMFAPLSTNGLAGGGPVPRFFDDTPPEADLELQKTVEPDVATPGVTEVVYTLTVTNNGPSEAKAVEVSDILPAGMSYVSDDSGCVVADHTVTCAVGDLADSADAVINITASVDGNASGVLTNNAVAMSESPEPAPDPNSNSRASTSPSTGIPSPMRAPTKLLIPPVSAALVSRWTDRVQATLMATPSASPGLVHSVRRTA